MNDFHPNTPKKLITALTRVGSERKYAKAESINISYVSQLTRHGIEPTDKTANGRAIRMKLFLPCRKRKPSTKPPVPTWVRDIRKRIATMAKDTRRDVLHRLEKI